MWHDKWNDEGLISNMISMETVIEAGLDRNMKVADMVKQGVWQWPANWHNDIPVVNTISVPRLNKRKDKVLGLVVPGVAIRRMSSSKVP
ncbi:hypothetical protein Tco_0564708 [Tanacetum coccineum]